ncbi:RHS repeat protein [Streptomyces pactum]|uniref:RHS repeat protein n=1 Tax=Streptomyces pactum TaxID=68249 RepID=A0ABS0NNC1_9ACTN|nr:RHS repeat-associated core domain-containing protein [Streptomyces pactum]MBH5336704.1 RHS repeat protein [Streptomyces pactum]
MGWLDDYTPDVIEDAVEDGLEVVGEGTEYLSGKAADGLDKVGADGAADWVRDKGKSVANHLGADVSEMGLDETDDPKKLVYGSASKLRTTVSHLRDFQTAFTNVGDGLKRLDSAHWKGEAADAFRAEVAVEPKKWFKAADACEAAATALEDFASTVEWAQGQAQLAIDAYQQAKKNSEAARTAYNNKVAAYDSAATEWAKALWKGDDPGPEPVRPAEFEDPGPAGVKAAQAILDEARRQRDEAAGIARTAVRTARDAAPPKPSYGEQVADGNVQLALDAEHVVGGVLKGGSGVIGFVRSVNPIDPYNITHPAEYLTSLNNTAAGLVSLANDPVGAGQRMLAGFKEDPYEGFGRMIPEVLGTRGLGGVRSGVNAARTASHVRPPRGAPREQLARDPHRNTTPSRQRCNGPTDPIDLATGTMYLPQTDIVLHGELPLVFTRQVQSGYRSGQWFGPSWASTVDQRLEIDAEGVVLVGEDGLLLAYPHPAPGVPTLPHAGPRWPLERDVHGDYTLTDPLTGHTRHFAGPPEAGAPGGDGTALLTSLSDRGGHRISFAYDRDGAPTHITHSAGHELRLTTAGGRITALHLVGAAPDGGDQEVVRYGYTDGDLTEVTGSSGIPLRFTYDDEHRVIAWTDTNGSRYDYVYDNQDRCIAEGGEAGHLSLRISYDGTDAATGHRVTTVTTAEGHTSRYLVNDLSQVVAVTDPLGHTTRTRYDRYGHVLTRTDALGSTTTYTYDDAGRPTGVTGPDGTRSTVVYDDLGLPTALTGPDGTWRQTYDEAGRRTSVTDPAGHTTSYAYDEHGHLAAVTDATGATTRVRCDAAGLPLEITDPLGGTTVHHRDAFGRPITVIDPTGGTTHLSWTVEGRLARRTDPDGSTSTWTYDGEGNCLSHTDPAGGTTTYEYTHFDLLAARTGPDGVRHTFRYDTALRLTEVINPQGLTWTYTYDPAGRLVSEKDFDGRRLSYTHDAAGRLRSRTNPLGQTVTYERDVAGRTVRKDADGRITTYTYDPAGRLLSAAGPDAEVVYQRDRLGRVKSEMVAGRVLTHTYDPVGRRTRRTSPTGATTHYSYDAAGNRTSLTIAGHTLDSVHDAAGRETTRRIGDTLTLAHTFDPLGRLTGQSLTGADGALVQHRAYTYRADGHLVGLDDHLNGPRSFDLDPAGRVTAVHARAWTENYAYDEAGNLTRAAWPAEHPSQEAAGTRAYTGTRLTRAGDHRYEHDEAGRLTVRRKTRLSKKPDIWRYEWDAEDRLRAVITPDGTTWRYRYDPFGRRIAKQRMDADGEIAEETTFTWDGPTLVEQTTTAPALRHPVTLTWDHAGLRPVAQTERITDATTQREIDSRFFAIVTDLVGTPTELVDETGTIAWRTRSTLWGTTTWATDSTAYTPLRFPGQYFDPETGLHYNVFRYYDPATARYLSPDPLGLDPAPNPATYVDNPHAWTDPLGLAPCPEGRRPSRVRSLLSKVFGESDRAKAERSDMDLRNRRVPVRLEEMEAYTLPDYGDAGKIRDMSGMSDDRLLDAINNPDDLGAYIIVSNGEISQGNHRIHEALERMRSDRHPTIKTDTEIWIIR